MVEVSVPLILHLCVAIVSRTPLWCRIAGTNIRSTTSTMSASLPRFKPLALPPESALHRELGAAIAVSAPEKGATSAVGAQEFASSRRDNVPNFEDPAASYASFSLWELVR